MVQSEGFLWGPDKGKAGEIIQGFSLLFLLCPPGVVKL